MTQKKVIIGFLFNLLFIAAAAKASAIELRDGDIIFHTSRSSQSIAIQLATQSKQSHMGIIFFNNGEPHVFEAIRTVQSTPLKQWIARGVDGRYVIKRLRNARKIMTDATVRKLKSAAEKFHGKPYDLTFEWSDDRIYCSELVWKIYNRAIGLQLGKRQQLREFNLEHPAVKAKMTERYGKQIPLLETVISPGEIFRSDLLETVTAE